ncbi:MAG: FAD/NAD(P)-binding protein, partial [Actinomycetota bacterium]|nr:FAD/NAD(P)-binding protein [Actinomycetota bacterium]
ATLLVSALRRCRAASRTRVVVLGAGHEPGRGVAYSTTDGQHLMNVPVRRLSVDPENPGHLTRWLDRRESPSGAEAYIPRQLYGDYLSGVLDEAIAERGSRASVVVDLMHGRVISVEPAHTGWRIETADGASIWARSVVLAGGPPCGPGPFALPEDSRVVRDPWSPGALAALAGLRRVLVVGSGLTMVDVAVTLAAGGVQICAVSRHGWLPGAHPSVRRPAARPMDVPVGGLTAATVRRLVVDHARREPNGWQAGMDDARDHAEEIWAALPQGEQAKLLRRGLSAWMVHRHRMAPVVARRLDALVDGGRVDVQQGTAQAVHADEAGVELTVRRDGSLSVLRGDALVICTGPSADINRTDDLLVRSLLDDGTGIAGPHRLGLAVDRSGALIDGHGRSHGSLFVIGALRHGSLFETRAIPELRSQAAELAPLLIGRLTPSALPSTAERSRAPRAAIGAP